MGKILSYPSIRTLTWHGPSIPQPLGSKKLTTSEGPSPSRSQLHRLLLRTTLELTSGRVNLQSLRMMELRCLHYTSSFLSFLSAPLSSLQSVFARLSRRKIRLNSSSLMLPLSAKLSTQIRNRWRTMRRQNEFSRRSNRMKAARCNLLRWGSNQRSARCS